MPKRSKKEAEGGAAGETGAPPKPARKKKATEKEEGAPPKPARKKKATEEEEGAPPKPARKKKTKTEEEEGAAPGPGGKKAGEAEGDAEEEEEERGGDEEGGGAPYRDPPTRETTPCGRRFTLKVTSWNVDGLRAWVRKGGLQWVQEEAPDVLCLQETKCGGGAVPPEVRALPRLPHQYWASASQRPGYSGVGLLARLPPLAVTYGIGDEEHDAEGRVVTAEFPGLFVVAAYVPNAGRGLTRLAYRQRWDAAFRAYLAGLDARKPVALCGDLNVAHEPIDLRHPGPNRRSPGFTPQERAAFGELLAAGFFDSFRHLYPALRHAYTFWTYLGGARRRNVGWRLDYFVLSRRLEGALCDSKIRSHVPGSDHCPITLLLAL